MDVLNEASKDTFIEIDPRKLHWSAKTYAQKLLKRLPSLPFSIFQMVPGEKNQHVVTAVKRCPIWGLKIFLAGSLPRFRDNFTPIYKPLMCPYAATPRRKVFGIPVGANICFAFVGFLHLCVDPVFACVIHRSFFAVKV
jgi:hypothetical protein